MKVFIATLLLDRSTTALLVNGKTLLAIALSTSTNCEIMHGLLFFCCLLT